MKVKILGAGCSRCSQLENLVREVAKEVGVEATFEEIKEVKDMMQYPIMATPGLVLNEKLVCFGRVPSKADVTRFVMNALSAEGPA